MRMARGFSRPALSNLAALRTRTHASLLPPSPYPLPQGEGGSGSLSNRYTPSDGVQRFGSADSAAGQAAGAGAALGPARGAAIGEEARGADAALGRGTG